MSDVNFICDKSFSEVDQEIVDSFIEFQQALIDKNLEKLDEIILDVSEFIDVVGKYQSKNEFISQIDDGTLRYSNFDILEPTILFDDENSASLIAKIRLSIAVNGKELRVISDSVVSFEKVDEKWHISKWDN